MTSPVNFGTAGRIIRMAMEDAGLLQDGDSPTSEQLAKNMQRLNDMINLWQTQGLKLFLLEDKAITLVAGTRTYTLGPLSTPVMVKPMRVIQAYWLSAQDVKVPLIPMGWEEYLRLSKVTSQGAVTSYLVDKQATSLEISLWNTPDASAATGTVHVLLQKQAQNMISLTEALLFPPEWFIALRWGLADEISTGQPQAIMQRCQDRARMYREALEDWDVEDASTRFEPSPLIGSYSKFN